MVRWADRTTVTGRQLHRGPAALASGGVRTTALQRTLDRFALPTVPGAADAREEAVALLQAAAEIEHALLVQYLFASYSNAQADDFNAELAETIRIISVQEMGHLMAVQNLLLALGARPYFARQDESPQPEFDPYPFRLDRIDRTTLCRFTAAEMPDISAITDPQQVVDIAAILAAAKSGLKAPEIHRVGLIYLRLFWLFQDIDAPDPKWPDAIKARGGGQGQPNAWRLDAFDPAASLPYQSDRRDWDSTGSLDLQLSVVADKAQARDLIYAIAAQGEGSPPSSTGSQGSHFDRFFKASVEVVRNNTPITAVSLAQPEQVTEETANAGSNLFDLRYQSLMCLLALSLHYERTVDGTGMRARLKGWLMNEMRMILPSIASTLMSLPAGTDPAGPFTPPPFGVPSDPLPMRVKELWTRLIQIIDDTARLRASGVNLEAFTALDAGFDAAEADRRATALVEIADAGG
jgi:Ferritin-like